jgi:hypothetical protein
VSTYRVSFDGKWQEDFDDVGSALDWAREVSETGRIVHVASYSGGLMRWIASPKLVAVFPESKAEEGRQLWKTRAYGHGVPLGGMG